MRQMMKPVCAGVVSLLLVTTACMQEETLHSIYIGPDGDVHWMVVEKDVRSDARGAEARRSEEAQWLDQSRNGDHSIAEAFRALEPTSLTWHVVRDTRPYTVLTEAVFGRIDELGRMFLDQLGMNGRSELSLVDGGFRWTLTVSPPECESGSADESPVIPLLINVDESYRIILEEGRFVDAVGFELSEGSTVARPIEREKFPDDGSPVVLSLTWKIEDGPHRDM